jgi:hypothetical protein
MSAKQKPPTNEERIEKLSQKSETELLARLLVEQHRGNELLERNRKNTSFLVTVVVVGVILYLVGLLIPVI